MHTHLSWITLSRSRKLASASHTCMYVYTYTQCSVARMHVHGVCARRQHHLAIKGPFNTE